METSHDNIPGELLAKYLAKTATIEEIDQVMAWLSQSVANEHELAAYRKVWERSGSLKQNRIHVNTDQAWSKVKSRMNTSAMKDNDDLQEIKTVEIPKTIQRKFPVAFRAAAVAALLIIASGIFFIVTEKTIARQLQVATSNFTTEKILPDGTKVFLNYNSTLTFPENFEGDIRSVSLKGEAFFDVKPDVSHPFVIDANGTEIKVLGTSFNVKAYEKEPVRVDVTTGKVSVRKADSAINLVKGESAEAAEDTVRSIIPDANITGYRTQIFDFNATDLKDVVYSIRQGYHIDLRLSDARIEQCRLTIRFEKEPVTTTLSVIAETLDLKIRKEGKTYWLEGNGCK